MSAYEQVPVAAPPAEVVATLRAIVRERGITEYAVVDHGHDMDAAGVPGIVAWTLVFGNPAGGSRLLRRDPTLAVDIPLRLAVIEADGGSAIVLRDMSVLLPDEAGDLAPAFTALLRSLAADAAARASGAAG